MNYTDVPEGERTHKNVTSFLDRFKVVAGDIGYSHTMVAHIAKEGHYYIHPDNFYFEGPRTAVFTQIGNAVPPLMAENIAKEISLLLQGKLPRQIELTI